MASTSAPTSELKESELSDPSCATGGSVQETGFYTALAHATVTSSSPLLPALGNGSVGASTESGKCSSVLDIAEQIERSKVHWSQVSEAALNPDDDDDDGAVVADNMEVFKALQSHPTWGCFFVTFGYDTEECSRSSGELEIGEKFAEGGQAELFHARVTWRNPKGNENDLKYGVEWVLKVFKKGTSLRHLQSQWPRGYLQFRGELSSTPNYPCYFRHCCEVSFGTLLQDGRFAFLVQKESEDLRCFINRRMSEGDREGGPFSKEEVEFIMYEIACGMNWLHERNIVHRDLKASNVLSRYYGEGSYAICVADFECSIGVIGTGFWRAPEILQAIKDKKVLQRPEVFSKKADVYAYGMTCYEILTGKFPFESHSFLDYDLVLNGGRPEVPKHVEDWIHELVSRCWEYNPIDRPSFGDIMNILVANSARIKESELEKKTNRK